LSGSALLQQLQAVGSVLSRRSVCLVFCAALENYPIRFWVLFSVPEFRAFQSHAKVFREQTETHVNFFGFVSPTE
jgi:hypothetical protein